MANREAHLAYVRSKAEVVKLGGPMTDDAGDMAGSLLILDVADRAAVEAFTAADPYSLAGLFERVEIRPIRITLGQP
ncbi:MAG: YciI family protein [Bauldia sp.]|nr:YciI family protein [Bauldia sp.]